MLRQDRGNAAKKLRLIVNQVRPSIYKGARTNCETIPL